MQTRWLLVVNLGFSWFLNAELIFASCVFTVLVFIIIILKISVTVLKRGQYFPVLPTQGLLPSDAWPLHRSIIYLAMMDAKKAGESFDNLHSYMTE